MKNILLFVSVFLVSVANAQTPFTTHDSINANNINARIMVHGDMWWDLATQQQKCEFPKGSGKHVGFAGALWLSGYDQSNKLHVAAQTYRQDGNDYWPGPLDNSGNLDYATSAQWAKIWKVTRAEINQYKATVYHTTSNTPSSILTWPAKGNAYARGKDSSVLVIERDMAPFVDLNGDGKYQPLKGEYPAIKGEQTLWWVFSDNGPTHAQSKGDPLKVEVQAMAYAYKRGTLIDNVVYYDYTLLNRSTKDYHDFRLAFMEDVQIGYYMDEFLAFDSGRRLEICYNGTNNDGGIAGNPSNSYGKNPPLTGVTLISQPGDRDADYIPAGSFMFYNNDLTVIGNPNVDTQYNHYMRSRYRNGFHIKYDPITNAWGVGSERDYVFVTDPTKPDGWYECSAGNNPGDRRSVLATNDFELKAGGRGRVVMAKVVSVVGGGCPGVSFNGIKEVSDTAWYNFYNSPVAVTNTAQPQQGLKVYPNPAHNTLIVVNETATDMPITICNMLGQVMGVYESRRGAEQVIDIGVYAPGVYVVKYINGLSDVGVTRFVKQ